jgi:hypothetical protein
MLNRDLIIVRLKQPFVDWVNEADPYSDGSRMTLDEANQDVSSFLIHDSASEDLEGWLDICYSTLFDALLEEWYVDESLWPQDRSLALFKRWCDVEVHSMVFDLVDGPLVDDDFDLGERLLHEDD